MFDYLNLSEIFQVGKDVVNLRVYDYNKIYDFHFELDMEINVFI